MLYYLPGRSAGLSLDEIRQAGLGYAIDGPLSSVTVRGGPDGGDGTLVALSVLVPPERLRYQADAQVWRKIPGVEAWVGTATDPDGRPKPADLARPRQLAGHLVPLADDRPWLVPVARGWTEEDGELRWYQATPTRSRLDDQGHWQSDAVLPRFARLWDLACRFEEARRQAILGADAAADGRAVEVAFDFDGLHEAAVEALAVNYRLGPAEADLLGLLSLDISREILEATIDLPTRIDWFKKKQSDARAAGSSTDAGSPGATPAIAPR